MKFQSRNVFGESLTSCSEDPLTGFYRNGCCDSGQDDHGDHMVCAVMTAEFLKFSKSKGNDLSTPIPQYNFPGLKLATDGAFVLPGGKKLMMPEWLQRLFSKQQMNSL